MTNNPVENSLARAAWDAYSVAVGGKAVSGDPLPTWDALCANPAKQTVVNGWVEAARAVVLQSFELGLAAMNQAYTADHAALHALVCNRVPCNQALADHPTILVDTNKVTPTETYAVGMLGVVNGVVEAMSGKRIAAVFTGADEQGRCRLIGFTAYMHRSDCAVHNEPALPAGPCDCTTGEPAVTAPPSTDTAS